MNSGKHLSLDDLMLFMDRELGVAEASTAERHIAECSDCSYRLKSLQAGSQAYSAYRERVLKPALIVDAEWQPLVQRASRPHVRPLWWAAAAAVICVLALAWPRLTRNSSTTALPSAQEVLARASAVPDEPHGTLLVSGSSYRFPRPARLQASDSPSQFRYVQALFIKADYNWQNPLSARSFARWRHQLARKRDYVTSIVEPSGAHAFRVQTRTEQGILQAASLTLQADNYHPTRADFDFQGEDPIAITEQSETISQAPAPGPAKTVETVASPEDELRVFAALNTIGADTEDPVDVKFDSGHHHILVSGMGLTDSRRKEVVSVLAGVPNTVVQFSSAQPGNTEMSNNPETDSSDSAAFRKQLQDRTGGARALQTMTDNAIDTTNGLFAQAHALHVLAEQFPPDIEAKLDNNGTTTLFMLRQRHVGAMDYALHQLKEELQSILTADNSSEVQAISTWQRGSADLYETSRNLDRLVSRLLSGSYSQQAGEQMLNDLPGAISKLQMLIRSQSAAGRK